MSVYERLRDLNISLPEIKDGICGCLVAPFVRSGNLIFLSGHIAKLNGEPWVGKLGDTLPTAQGKEAARTVAIDLLGTLHVAAGDLNLISRIVKLVVLVNSTPSFPEPHLVANGASELFREVFGDRGTHARCACGVAQIPYGSCIEIDLVAEVSA